MSGLLQAGVVPAPPPMGADAEEEAWDAASSGEGEEEGEEEGVVGLSWGLSDMGLSPGEGS
jgi:hypothetical protein